MIHLEPTDIKIIEIPNDSKNWEIIQFPDNEKRTVLRVYHPNGLSTYELSDGFQSFWNELGYGISDEWVDDNVEPYLDKFRIQKSFDDFLSIVYRNYRHEGTASFVGKYCETWHESFITLLEKNDFNYKDKQYIILTEKY